MSARAVKKYDDDEGDLDKTNSTGTTSRSRAIMWATGVLAVAMALTVPLLVKRAADATVGPEARLAKVQPFDDKIHLARALRGDDASYELGLGHIMPLDIYLKPKRSSDMPTQFNIYTTKRTTRNVKFRAKSPVAVTTGGLTPPLDPLKDFQYDLDLLAKSGFDVRRRTIIMTTGYMAANEDGYSRECKDLWMELFGEQEGGVNVINVGWADSNKGLYEQAAANTVHVGRQITILLHYLAQLAGTTLQNQLFLDRIHLVGHSLGAHISGYVGKDLGGRVGRITGLDPAGVVFDTFSRKHRLDSSDAKLVEIVHSNAGHMIYDNVLASMVVNTLPLLSGKPQEVDLGGPWFGIDAQLGHLDYYANSGRVQEGCKDPLHICDHSRAREIYLDVLRREAYLRKQSLASDQDRRLWAFHADDYEGFQAGKEFSRLCPHLLRVETHLNQFELAKSFDRCAVPLLDLTTPVNELIGELRDEFHVRFDARAEPEHRPRYYFRTRPAPKGAPRLIADQYLLKVYLDLEDQATSEWDPAKCPLIARLDMADGQSVELRLTGFPDIQAETLPIIAPFAHPAGSKSRANLEKLIAQLDDRQSDSDKTKKLFLKLFPRMVTMKFVLAQQSAATVAFLGTPAGPALNVNSECQIAIKAVEVHPVNAYAASNLGAVYGNEALQAHEKLVQVTTGEFIKRLASAQGEILTPGVWYESYLKSALVN